MRRALVVAAFAALARAADIQLTIDVAHPFRAVSDILYSAFTEDINHAITGGLHGELVSDPQARGPLVGGDDPPGAVRLSLTSAASSTMLARECGGAALANAEGGHEATFWRVPGLATTGCPALAQCVSFVNVASPKAYLVLHASGSGVSVAATDGSGSFPARATWAMWDGTAAAGTVVLQSVGSTSPSAQVLSLGPSNDRTCSWIGEAYDVTVTALAAGGATRRHAGADVGRGGWPCQR